MILVDESGSLSAVEVEEEKVAAQVLAFGMLSNASEVAVVGFGSSNGPGQSAVDPVCPLTSVDPSKQDFFVDCIDQLRRRGQDEGGDTDHVAALTQALSVLRAPGGEDHTKLVFLLTDGRLDVPNSPQYGGQPAARNTNAQILLDEKINEARGSDVQIWPLGFGDADQAALDAFAAGGAQQTCNNLPDNQPRARIVTSTDVVARTLLEAIASANCANTTPFDSDNLPGGSQVELTVNIPEISTDGVIVVLKGDERVRVTYHDPNGKEVTGTGTFSSDDSTFTTSTTSGTVETLRIQNPRPGDWKVRLEAGTDVPAQQVAAAALWQGVLQAIVTLDPITPQAGEDAVVRVRLQTRDGAIEDPSVLDGVTFSAQMTGKSVETQNIDVLDDGRNDDTQADDGEYTGKITIPADAEGVLTFTGIVDGPGVVGAKTPFNTTVSTGPRPVTASITVERDDVPPGGRIEGKAVIDNIDGTPRTLRLELHDLAPGIIAEIADSNIVESPRAGRVEQDFAIAVAPDSKEGNANGKIRLADTADPETAYAEAFFSNDVVIPPPAWAQLWWLWLLLALLLAGVAAILTRLRNESLAARSIGNITVQLSRGSTKLAELKAAAGSGTRFPFTIHDAQGGAPRLDNVYGNVARPYVVTRNRHGQVQVRTPDGANHTLPSPRASVPVESGLKLSYSESDAPTREGAVRRSDGYKSSSNRRGRDPYENATDPYAAAGRPTHGQPTHDAPTHDAPTLDPYGRPFDRPAAAGRNFDPEASTVVPGAAPHSRRGADEETNHLGDGRPNLTKGKPGTSATKPPRSSTPRPRRGGRNDDLLD